MTYELMDGIVIFRLTGTAAPEAFIELADHAAADAGLTRPTLVLIDARRVEGGPRFQDFQRVADYFETRREMFRPVQAVVVANLLQYGLGRMASMLGEPRGIQVHVFRDEAAAVEFLRSQPPA